MLKIVRELKRGKNLYEYDSHKTNDLDFAVYFIDVDQYAEHQVPIHWHKDFEICYVTQGTMLVQAAQSETYLHQGEAMFINANCIHGFRKAMNNSFYVSILFEDSFITGSYEKNSLYHKYISPISENTNISSVAFSLLRGQQKEALRLLEQIRLLAASNDDGFEFAIREALCRIMMLLYQYSREHTEYNSPVSRDTAIFDMISFIKKNYPNKLYIEDIAASANLSIRECSRRFHKYLSMSPGQYLELIRLNAAVELLHKTDLNITEICFEAGYLNSSYFCSKFKKLMGMTPNEYRKKLRSS